MLIDTHAHLNFNAYKDDADEVIKRTLENDVWMINVGSQYSTSLRAVEYAKKYPEGVFASVALHPIHLKSRKIKEEIDWQESLEFETREEKFDYEKYKELAIQSKVVAIGETGLDYYHLDKGKEEEQKKLQKESFIKHLELAKELNKPIIIHCREAHQDVLEILKSFIELLPERSRALNALSARRSRRLIINPSTSSGSKLSGVVHSFSGRWSQAQQYLEMGFYLGFNGLITFAFNGLITFARDYDKVIKNTPLERLLLETDCPYLAPIPFRGQRNEPLYVKYVAFKIAEIKGVSFDEIAHVTTENARNLFGI